MKLSFSIRRAPHLLKSQLLIAICLDKTNGEEALDEKGKDHFQHACVNNGVRFRSVRMRQGRRQIFCEGISIFILG